MQAKIVVAVVNLLVGYLQKHPHLIDAVIAELAKLIPGKIDDAVFAALRKLLGI